MEDPEHLQGHPDQENVQPNTHESRAYQIEMFEQAMRENTIVAMETGSGKTQIAKLRIEAELERSPQKRVWFCAPSVVLAQQQHLFLSSHLVAYQVRLITGLDNVQFWSTQEIWDAVLDKIDLVVSTPQVLLDALSHGFIILQQLSLLVFDEAHHCTSKEPMALIMQRFYHPMAPEHGDSLPHILGLTASPITNKPSMLRELERNMNAICKTPTLQLDAYRRHVYLPKLETIPFPYIPNEVSATLRALDSVVTGMTVGKDPTVIWLQNNMDKSPALEQKLKKIMESGRTPSMKQMTSFFGHALHINETLGSWSADLYVRCCASKLHDAVALQELLVPSLAEREQQYIDRKLQSALGQIPYNSDVVPAGNLIAPKAQAVIDYLLKEYRPGITVIIFVKRRSVAFALTRLLQECPLMKGYDVFSFVGATNPAYRTLVDLTDMQLQNEAFADFQNGKRNICIATQVMEEGVDVQATNLVIRFDEPENFRSFVQSRGRARQPDSKFVMVHQAEEANTALKLSGWKDLESIMKEQYSDRTRTLRDREVIEDEFEDGDETYRVPTTGALLTYDNARQHLEHFCATLPWVGDLQPAQLTLIVSEGPHGLKSARAILPSSVPSSLQSMNSLRSWRTERMAKKDAAFQAYRRLHMAKLVNDNLLPFPRARKEFGKGEGRDSIYQVQRAVDPWDFFMNKFPESTGLKKHRVRVSGDDFALPDMIMLLPLGLDSDLSFSLRSAVLGPILVKVSSVPNTDHMELDTIMQITRHLFGIILGRRLKAVNMYGKLPYLISPCITSSNLSSWLHQIQTTVPLSTLAFNDSLSHATYLIKHKEEEILYQWQPTFDGSEVRHYSLHDTIRAERLSKQLSYLQDSEADTGTESQSCADVRTLVVEDCHVQGLPTSYGMFMLLMPSISHVLSTTLRGQIATAYGPLKPIGFSTSNLVSKALTSSSASTEHNFESLEFVGDSLLKYYAVIQVFFDYPELAEGGLNARYRAIVSNARLQRATKELGLDAYITTEGFSGPKWTLAKRESEEDDSRKMSSKTLADVIEALIAAAYFDTHNDPSSDKLPLSALSHLFPDIRWKTPRDHIESFHRTSGTSKANIARLEHVELMLGYQFTYKTLLKEALTRSSLSIGIQSFQRLEFLGDAILDRIVNVALYESGLNLDPEELKYRRDALVNRWLLAFMAMDAHYDITTSRITTSGPSKTEQTLETKTIRLIDHMRTAQNPHELRQRKKAETTFLQAHDEIMSALNTGKTFPWVALHSISASKAYSDIIESILAAVFIDSAGSLQACEHVLESLGLIKVLKRFTTESDLELRQPIVVLGLKYPDVVGQEKATGKVENDNRIWSCDMMLDGELVASFQSNVSEKHAEACAAQMALGKLSGVSNGNDAMNVDS